ncbi:hypothetical protein P0M11_13225 [Kaistella sp. PBT33-4]|uniref:hypothetical protein n=1 Tax=Kaistella sp. PBT33-4 TaxID=3032000 RepID=UPI0023D83048|nr:hypothetical protein [Kaistella sp. PBT33-4]MDF0720961.1 hypothetical protein [Kaistella sp. PBT33-4]
MKFLFFILVFFIQNLKAQDLLSFINDEPLKNQIRKSILLIDLSDKIPQNIKDKIIFITYDNDISFDNHKIEYFGFGYSTRIPLQWSELDSNGQLQSHVENFIFFNYSKNIVLVFRGMNQYLDVNELHKKSRMTKISESNINKFEYFEFSKSNGFFEDSTNNSHSFERNDNSYRVTNINCPIDLDTFLKIWFDINISYFKLNGK